MAPCVEEDLIVCFRSPPRPMRFTQVNNPVVFLVLDTLFFFSPRKISAPPPLDLRVSSDPPWLFLPDHRSWVSQLFRPGFFLFLEGGLDPHDCPKTTLGERLLLVERFSGVAVAPFFPCVKLCFLFSSPADFLPFHPAPPPRCQSSIHLTHR